MAEPKRRPQRVPVGTRNVLTAPKREGYHRRFVNDTDDRIQTFIDAGYEVVKGDVSTGDDMVGNASKMGSAVSKSVGQGTKAVLMEIRQEWYDEDQKAKHNEITASESAMKQKRTEGQYGEIKIGH